MNKLLERLPFRIELEPRLVQPPRWYPWVLSLLSVVVALLIGAIVLALAGGNPWASYAHIARASFGDIGVFSDTLVKAIPLMLVGLACALAFRMKLWNIGAEGQFFIGAFGASAVVLLPVLPEDAPRWLFILTMIVFGMAAGRHLGLHPRFAQGPLPGQRDHLHPDAQLHRHLLEQLLHLRGLDRWRFPDVAKSSRATPGCPA